MVNIMFVVMVVRLMMIGMVVSAKFEDLKIIRAELNEKSIESLNLFRSSRSSNLTEIGLT
jgi:hypothetical protein